MSLYLKDKALMSPNCELSKLQPSNFIIYLFIYLPVTVINNLLDQFEWWNMHISNLITFIITNQTSCQIYRSYLDHMW